MGAGTMYAATAAKGVFTVNSSGKIVQFANANSIYRDTALIQWANLGAATDAGWDVLTSEEWTYLLVTRDGEGTSKNNLGKVNGKKGLVILPDEWVQPEGTAYAATPLEYETNQYTTEQWAKMAEAGAVFLPCAGYGHNPGTGYIEENTDDHGAYWAKDEYNSANAYCMKFNPVGLGGSIHDVTNGPKTNYYSVILVRDVTVTVLDEEDDATAYNTHWSAAKGKYFAYVNRTLKKDGTLYTLCLPFDVPNIDNSPLAGAEVFTFNGGTVGGSTGSEVLHLSLSRLTGKRLTQGVPYLLRWENTGETLTKPLYFENVENWDDDTNAATDPGNATVKMHGVYPKAHIDGYTSDLVAHYNFFLGANNTLYWPDDSGNEGEWASHMMKGFRAYFYIVHEDPDPDPAPRYRNMPTVWEIEGALGSTTSVEGIQPSAVSIQKELREGQIILIIDGEMYDLMGRKIKD